MFGMGKGSKASPAPAAAKAAKKPATVAVTVRLEPRLRDKLELLGGDSWLREQLEKARVPAVFGGD